jgi:2-methylcitrate dehydratase
MSPISRRVAEWAAGAQYRDLPNEVVRHCKRFLLDAVGCALDGARQPDVRIARQVVAEIAGQGPATVLVSGERRDPVSASLLNALMIRVLDYNDIYWKQDPCHPSDLIPAAMAAVERARGSGRELLLGIALGYELEQRLCEIAFPGVRELGWHHATLTAVASPIVAGRMLGLDATRLQHAVGISASRHCTLGAVTAGKLTMMKNTVDPLAVQSGVLAALLAERGYTGPEHVLDGKEGLGQVIGSEWRWDGLTEGLGQDWRILQCAMKLFPSEALTHTPISAVLELVETHDLQPEQIESITIHSLGRVADILADPSKYEPHTKETADHSLPFVVAAALVDREVTPRSFSPERIADPRLRAQLGKVRVVADPEIEQLFPALQRVRVVITTSDGRRLERQLDYPKGDPRNPLTDAELRAKFCALGQDAATPVELERMLDAIASAEQYDDASQLMAALVVSAG